MENMRKPIKPVKKKKLVFPPRTIKRKVSAMPAPKRVVPEPVYSITESPKGLTLHRIHLASVKEAKKKVKK